ncbi:uncharacterized protein LOC128231633 isoform X2 [Mya arenaria]|uniref:uncharacterized protein LOC128231633 isoform X2 n=1 Tax=Mya arenaria TaxID=6604 RepID=UPI0022E82C1E|nr:uncharacterized protein LOC128231633 isoform X2 [Mya arenaria]
MYNQGNKANDAQRGQDAEQSDRSGHETSRKTYAAALVLRLQSTPFGSNSLGSKSSLARTEVKDRFLYTEGATGASNDEPDSSSVAPKPRSVRKKPIPGPKPKRPSISNVQQGNGSPSGVHDKNVGSGTVQAEGMTVSQSMRPTFTPTHDTLTPKTWYGGEQLQMQERPVPKSGPAVEDPYVAGGSEFIVVSGREPPDEGAESDDEKSCSGSDVESDTSDSEPDRYGTGIKVTTALSGVQTLNITISLNLADLLRPDTSTCRRRKPRPHRKCCLPRSQPRYEEVDIREYSKAESDHEISDTVPEMGRSDTVQENNQNSAKRRVYIKQQQLCCQRHGRKNTDHTTFQHKHQDCRERVYFCSKRCCEGHRCSRRHPYYINDNPESDPLPMAKSSEKTPPPPLPSKDYTKQEPEQSPRESDPSLSEEEHNSDQYDYEQIGQAPNQDLQDSGAGTETRQASEEQDLNGVYGNQGDLYQHVMSLQKKPWFFGLERSKEGLDAIQSAQEDGQFVVVAEDVKVRPSQPFTVHIRSGGRVQQFPVTMDTEKRKGRKAKSKYRLCNVEKESMDKLIENFMKTKHPAIGVKLSLP